MTDGVALAWVLAPITSRCRCYRRVLHAHSTGQRNTSDRLNAPTTTDFSAYEEIHSAELLGILSRARGMAHRSNLIKATNYPA
jgi:hypothetical protein